MFNFVMSDNQIATVHANPWTSSVPGRAARAFNFQVAISGNSDPTNLLQIAVVADGSNTDPKFTIKPKFTFFGPDRVITLSLSGINDAQSPVKTSTMTVTVQGTQPDDGKLDHFEPIAEPPVAQ